jgi:linoleoyl-CoA desaturase
MYNSIRFAAGGKGSFQQSITAKVNSYFKTHNLSPYANAEMWVKTIVMLLLYFVPYTFILLGFGADNLWLFFGLWVLMSFGMIGIGTCVMHDANHGTYSPNKNVNGIVAFILDIIGGYTVTWKIQHNYLHHTYTNITGLDEDIDSIKLLRFSPQQPLYWFHRYQHLYVWFFYMLMTLFWMTVKDYIQIYRYNKHGLLARQNVSLAQAVFRISAYKILYYSYVIVLPILFSGIPWYYIVAGFLVMHAISGLFLSCIFQPSHIVEASTFQLPTGDVGKQKMADSWAVHEIENTTDFAPNNPFLTWFVGGLNYQIEHHLFPGICHVHFPKLAPIVKDVAAEHGVTYHVEPTFWQALVGHVKMLRKLGRQPELNENR